MNRSKERSADACSECGTGLELQAFEIRSDDYGDYRVTLPKGIRVRYELGVAG
jgi:hypothetical protein